MTIDQQATVCRILRDGWEWQVKFQGTYWTARAVETSAHFRINDHVYVVGRQNLTLLIQPFCP